MISPPVEWGVLTVISNSTIPSEREWGCIWRHFSQLLLAHVFRVFTLSHGVGVTVCHEEATCEYGEVGLVTGGLDQSKLGLLSIGPELFHSVHYPPSTRL
jgi:hypothetical protein